MAGPSATIDNSHHRRARTSELLGIAVPLLLLAAGCTSGGPAPGPVSTTITRPSMTAVGPPASSGEPAPSGRPAVRSDQLTASSGRPPASATGAAPSGRTSGNLQVGTVATGLTVPWGLGFLPDGTALVAGRDDGTITEIAPVNEPVTGESRRTATTLGTIDGVAHGGEGGLLGLAVSPEFAADGLLYVYYTAEQDNRIATVTLRDGALVDQRVILTGIPKGGIHNGGRLAFGPEGLLYVGTGDSGERSIAQDLGSLGGKILRLAPDGSPAPGNPFPQAPDVYSYGHRNVQGIAFDDRGRVWASEFGQNTWDELNLITAGGNYGWPDVEGQGAREGFIDPVRVWPTDAASPSGIAFWHGSIWMAGLRGERLWEIPLIDAPTGAPTAEPVAQLTNVFGRLRTVQVAPDGRLWVTTSNTDGRGDVRDGDDRILQLRFAP